MNYIEKKRLELEGFEKDALIDKIINRYLNDFVGRYADGEDGEEQKFIPYMGWYWRDLDFANGRYPVGRSGEYIGFMANNKWDYPERELTPEEATQVTEIVCNAVQYSRGGGILSEIEAWTKGELGKLAPLLQTFKIHAEGFWIHGPLGQVAHADTEEDAEEMITMLSRSAPGLPYWKVEV